MKYYRMIFCLIISIFLLAFSSNSGPLIFLDDQPLSVTWSEIESGEVKVIVCNVGDTALPYITPVLLGFDFKINGEITNTNLIRVDGNTSNLVAGSCTELSIIENGNGDADSEVLYPDNKFYTGSIAIYSPSAGIIRLKITIKPEYDDENPEPPEEPTAKLDFIDNSDRSFDWNNIQEGIDIDLCNTGNILFEAPLVELLGFNFHRGTIGLNTEDILSVSILQDIFYPNTCEIIQIIGDHDTISDIGNYSGVLRVSYTNSKGEIERLDLKINIDVKGISAPGDKLVIEAIRTNPFSKTTVLENNYILNRNPW